MEIRPDIAALLAVPDPLPSSGELISVSSATRRIAFAYERFRNTLEPDEADTLRRKAIFRILERRLQEDRPSLVIATALLQELMRAHYIEPMTVTFAQRLAEMIERVQVLYEHLEQPHLSWFLHIVAVAIDREIYPRAREEQLVQVLYQDALKRTVWMDALVAEKDKATQLYIACHRALFYADDFEVAYHYFIHHVQEWKAAELGPKELVSFRRSFSTFYEQMQQVVHHPARNRLRRLLNPVAVPYRLIRDLLRDNPAAFSESAEQFELAVREALSKRTGRLRERMQARAWHSVLFLFLTKTFVAVLLELPYDRLTFGQVHWLALIINIVFHPLLLFVLVLAVRLPGKRNAEVAEAQVGRIVQGEGELPTIVINATRTYGALTWTVFGVIYALLFMGIFFGLAAALGALGFSLFAIGMFVVFLGLVSFLSFRIRRTVDAIRVIPAHEGALTVVISFLSLPILEFGSWLTQNISQLNVALFVMDQILEEPFKLLIDVTEEWFAFVRDRREEIS